MREKDYQVKFESNDSRSHGYETILENKILIEQVSDQYRKWIRVYLMNNCALIVRDDSNMAEIKDAKISILHENSEDKINFVKRTLEQKTGWKLEEIE